MNTMQALGHKEPTQLGNEVNQVQERQTHAWLYCQCMCRNATQSTGERGLWNGQLMTGTRVWNVRTVGLGHDKVTVSDQRDGCLIDWFTGQQLFLTGLEAQKSKNKVPKSLILDDKLLYAGRQVPPYCVFHRMDHRHRESKPFCDQFIQYDSTLTT